MTRFSSRLAIPLAVLLALTLGGTLYGRSLPQRDECASREALLAPEAFDPPLEVATNTQRWLALEKGRVTAAWRPGGEQAPAVAVGIIKTYGLPNLLLEPALALPGRNEPDDVRSGRLATGAGPVTAHYAYERRGRRVRVTAYLMAHRGRAIESPVWTRLLEGPSALRGGSWPITVFAGAASGHLSRIEERRAILDQWLRQAWEHYREVCAGG